MADQYDAGVGERSVSSLCQTQRHGSLGQRCRKEEEQGRIIHWFDVLWCFSLPFCFDLTGQVKGSQTSFGFLERCLLADVLTSRSRTRDEWQDGCTDECSRGSAGGGAPVRFYQKVRFTLNRERFPTFALQLLLQVVSVTGGNVLHLGARESLPGFVWLKQLSNFLLNGL